LRVLYLFSGAERKADVRQHLETLLPAQLPDAVLSMSEVDLARDSSHDLKDADRCADFVRQVQQGQWEVVFVTPPCNTFSRAHWSRRPGPRPCRSKQWPRGFPWANARDKQRAEDGNHFLDFVKDIISAAAQRPHHKVLFLMEHPEDLGRTPAGDPASVWQDAALMRHVGGDTFTMALRQCVFGVDYPKLTRLLTNMVEMAAWGYVGPPVFSVDNEYQGPLPKDCTGTCSSLGWPSSGRWRPRPRLRRKRS